MVLSDVVRSLQKTTTYFTYDNHGIIQQCTIITPTYDHQTFRLLCSHPRVSVATQYDFLGSRPHVNVHALMRTFHFPTTMSISLWSILNRFGADKAASYSRLSTGSTGHFRITVWDPALIVAQIVSVQCLYYFTMCVWIAVISYMVGTSSSLDVIFQFKELSTVAREKFVIAVFGLNALCGATFIWRIVERYRLCLDFSSTIHIIHLVACIWYNGTLPTPFWWLLNAACAAITCMCAEFLCMRTELNAIPVNSGQTPKVDL